MNGKLAKKLRKEARLAGLTEEQQYANVALQGYPKQVVLAECQKALEKQLKRELKEGKVK